MSKVIKILSDDLTNFKDCTDGFLDCVCIVRSPVKLLLKEAPTKRRSLAINEAQNKANHIRSDG